MLSSGEIKQVALSIETELFNYYGSTSQDYRSKYQRIIKQLRDPTNKVNTIYYLSVERLIFLLGRCKE